MIIHNWTLTDHYITTLTSYSDIRYASLSLPTGGNTIINIIGESGEVLAK